MANVLHKQTMEYLVSVNTPDYDDRYWIINPDLSNVEGVPRKYWKLEYPSGGTDGTAGIFQPDPVVVEMDQSEKVIVNYNIEKYYKIYDYIETKEYDPQKPPYELDYNILGLFKKRTFNQGELNTIEYYGSFDGANYDILVVKEERFYYRVSGWVVYRDATITWYWVDGTPGEQKVSRKWYTQKEGVEEGITRRNNLLNQVKVDTIGIIAMVEQLPPLVAEEPAKMILRQLDTELGLYIEGDIMPVVNKIKDMSSARLDYFVPGTGNTLRLRDYILMKIIH
jgi:hypothetical protein